MAITNNPIRNGLSRRLDRLGISSADLAKATGYSVAAVKSWRSGSRRPSVGARKLIADTIGATVATVMRLYNTQLEAEDQCDNT